jgi:hypothetical protein
VRRSRRGVFVRREGVVGCAGQRRAASWGAGGGTRWVARRKRWNSFASSQVPKSARLFFVQSAAIVLDFYSFCTSTTTATLDDTDQDYSDPDDSPPCRPPDPPPSTRRISTDRSRPNRLRTPPSRNERTSRTSNDRTRHSDDTSLGSDPRLESTVDHNVENLGRGCRG